MQIAVFLCLPGNGKCSPGKENSRMLADISAPNGETVPQGPNSPGGECSVIRYTFLQSSKNSCRMSRGSLSLKISIRGFRLAMR